MLSPEEISAMLLSIKVAVCAVIVLLIPGVALGFLLARTTFPCKRLVGSIVHIPLVMPPIVTGYLLLFIFGANGVIGRYLKHVGLDFAFNWKGAVLACAVVAFPLMVQSVKVAIEMVDARLEQTASTLGANPIKVFMTITLPLSIHGIISGVILTFARSLGEFGATITFVGNINGQTRTLPLAIYTMMQRPDGDFATWRLLFVSLALSLTAVMVSEMIIKKRHLVKC